MCFAPQPSILKLKSEIRSSSPIRDSQEPLATPLPARPKAARSGSFAVGTARAVLRARRCSSVLQAGPGLGSGVEDRTQRCRGYGHRDQESAVHAQYLYLLLVLTGFIQFLPPHLSPIGLPHLRQHLYIVGQPGLVRAARVFAATGLTPIFAPGVQP